MRILALDDERNALEMLMQTIEEVAPEAELHGFRNSEAALYWAEEHAPIDVAFLDIQMRGITGLTVAKRQKKPARASILFLPPVTANTPLMHAICRAAAICSSR